MKIIIKDDCRPKKQKVRLYPKLGLFTKQSGPVVPSPQFRGALFGGSVMAAFTLKDDENVVVTLGFKDKKGNPSPPPTGATITWGVSNTDVLSITPAGDSLSCMVSAIGPLTTATTPDVLSVSVTDANNVALAAGTLEISVVSAAPTTVDLIPAAPTKQP